MEPKLPAIRTSLFAAAIAADFLQLDGKDILRPVKERNGEILCSLGQDDEWLVRDQEIEIDALGTAQVKIRECGGSEVVRTIRFLMSRPLIRDDLS